MTRATGTFFCPTCNDEFPDAFAADHRAKHEQVQVVARHNIAWALIVWTTAILFGALLGAATCASSTIC